MKFTFERSVLVCLSLVALGHVTGAFAFVHHHTTTHPTARAVGARYARPYSIQTSYKRENSGVQYPAWFASHVRPSSSLYSSESSAAGDDEEKDDVASTPAEEAEASTTKLTLRERWAKAFPKKKEDDLPFRQRLAKMGLACVLSYGFVSNMNAGITTGLSWFVFAKRVS